MFPSQPASPQPQLLQQELIQPEIPPNSKFSFLKSIKLWQIVVLLILLIPITGYLLSKNQTKPASIVQTSPTSTSDPTADWKTYQNNLGFSLRYPGDKLVACDLTAQTQLNLWKAPFDCPEGHDIPYEVQVSVQDEYKPYGQLSKTEKLIVDGADATKYSYIYTEEHGPLAGEESTEIVIPYKGSFIALALLGKTSEQKERFDQILSTFKFTENYLLIKEMGIKIPLSNSNKDLIYQVDENYGKYFTGGKVLAHIDLGTASTIKYCQYGYLGGINKIEGLIPNDVKPDYILDNNGNKLEYLLKQFNGFYINYFHAQDECKLLDGSTFPSQQLQLDTVNSVNNLQLTN